MYYSLEAPRRGTSNEYRNMFSWRNKKNISWIPPYLELCSVVLLLVLKLILDGRVLHPIVETLRRLTLVSGVKVLACWVKFRIGSFFSTVLYFFLALFGRQLNKTEILLIESLNIETIKFVQENETAPV